MSQQNYLTRVTGVTVNPDTPPHQPHSAFDHHYDQDTTPSSNNHNDDDDDDEEDSQSAPITSSAIKQRSVGPRPPTSAAAASAAAVDADTENHQHLPTIMLRSLVTTKEAGVIIGKGGQNVAEVRDATGVKAGVSKVIPGVHERILTITGTTLGVAKAFSMIANHLLENPVSPQPPAYADCTTIRLLVAHQIMGSIIGKGGAKIREIQEESGAKLIISKDMLPQSTERVIDVFGLIESIKIAVFSIAECIVNDLDRAAGTIHYNPQIRLSTSTTSPTSTSMNGGMMARTGRFDSPISPTEYRRPSGSNGAPVTRGRSGSQGAAGGLATAAGSATTELTQTLPVPTDMVGCIIGKGGSFISSIRRHSNARLRISEAIEGATERVVTIVGTSAAIAKALQMIHDQLESEKQRRLDAAEM